EVDEVRIERLPGTLTEDLRGPTLIVQRRLEGRITGQGDNPQRPQDLRTSRPLEWATAVPSLGEVTEHAGDASRKAESDCKQFGHLAQGCDVLLVAANSAG